LLLPVPDRNERSQLSETRVQPHQVVPSLDPERTKVDGPGRIDVAKVVGFAFVFSEEVAPTIVERGKAERWYVRIAVENVPIESDGDVLDRLGFHWNGLVVGNDGYLNPIETEDG
jgi:hypothetical protein